MGSQSVYVVTTTAVYSVNYHTCSVNWQANISNVQQVLESNSMLLCCFFQAKYSFLLGTLLIKTANGDLYFSSSQPPTVSNKLCSLSCSDIQSLSLDSTRGMLYNTAVLSGTIMITALDLQKSCTCDISCQPSIGTIVYQYV